MSIGSKPNTLLLVIGILVASGAGCARAEIDALDTKLTAKIDANTSIREGYQDVLDQQKGMLNLLKWATILVPIAVALAPTITVVVKHLLNIG